MNNALKTELNKVSQISEDNWNTLESILVSKIFRRNDVLLQEGQFSRGTYFIVEGAFRTFHLKEGNEIHTAFYFENDFIRDIESLSNGTPSKVNILAMEDAKTLYIEKDKMFELYQQAAYFQELGRKLLELMVISERRYASLFTDFQPKQRYQHIVSTYPELIQRVPLQFLASFLGVARETLSRIRKRVR